MENVNLRALTEQDRDDLNRLILAALGSDSRLKRMEELLERVVDYRAPQKERGVSFESTELRLEIPPPPDDLSKAGFEQYDRNAGLLLRWARTDKAQKSFP